VTWIRIHEPSSSLGPLNKVDFTNEGVKIEAQMEMYKQLPFEN
jgi:hypothetical protein